MKVHRSSKPPRVLVVDADSGTRPLLTKLRELGFEVYVAGLGEDAVPAGLTVRPDLVVLDVFLPDGDGFETYGALRAAGIDAPVLFLTAHDRTEAKVRGLMLGADDYVTKPFELEELVARVHVLLRRGRALDCRLLRAGDVTLDPATREVWRDGREVTLSCREFDLLGFLMDNAGQVVTKAQILDRVWRSEFHGESGVVETYVYYLRRKLGDRDQSLIRTVRGVGYLMARDAGHRAPSAQ
ncbi:response regulator transcription factor [Streptomyces canus]|nr:response regulator transcription factor [Streptomyces canus]